MIVKVIMSCIILMFLMAISSIWSTAIQPEVYTNLTLEQFKNPSVQTDTSLRMLSGIDFSFVLFFIVWVLITLFMFKREIVNVCTKLFS